MALFLFALLSLLNSKVIILQQEPLIKAYYSFPYPEKDIIRFKLEYHTQKNGYIGFGTCYKEGMNHLGDLIFMNFVNGIPQIRDAHNDVMNFDGEPQDWTLLSGTRENGIITFVIERSIVAMDNKYDLTFKINKPSILLWAFGQTDYADYHGPKNRGVARNIVIFRKK